MARRKKTRAYLTQEFRDLVIGLAEIMADVDEGDFELTGAMTRPAILRMLEIVTELDAPCVVVGPTKKPPKARGNK